MLKARNYDKYRYLVHNALTTYRNQDALAKLRARQEDLHKDYTE